jgi:protein O-mannosyl-transferase
MKMEVSQQTRAGLFSAPGNRRAVLCLLLALLTLSVYNPVAQNGFVNFDDPAYITANKHVQSEFTGQTVRWAFRTTESANWHPLTWLSHAIDYQLFHLKPVGHHYTNVLLHALAVVLIYLFLEATTGLAWRSAAVAALFAVHPVNVESVAWASERKNVLCTVFFLLGLCAYAWYARKPGLKRYLAVALSFALGLLSKPMVITFPLLLLLLDYWPLRRMNFSPAQNDADAWLQRPTRPFGRLVLEKLPLLALSAASAVITIIAQKSGGAIHDEHPLPIRAANALISYSRYIGKAIWPSHLAAMYPFPQTMPPVWNVMLAALVVLSITSAALILNRKRYLAVGWFWLLGTLVPVIGLLQVGEQAMADRYAYIPFIGLFVAAVWGIADWAASRRIAVGYLAALALIATAGLSIVTHAQIAHWQSGMTLWTHTLEVTDHNFVAEDNLGAELLKMGRLPEARAHFEAATEINPRDAFSQLDLGVCDKQLGNVQGALEHYEAALKLSSDRMLRSTTLSNIGSLYRMSGNYTAARENYAAAIQINPENAPTLIGLGLVAQRVGDFGGAVDYYSRAVRAEPSDAGYLLMAQALAQVGRGQEANAAWEQAKQAAADLKPAQQAVDRLLRE